MSAPPPSLAELRRQIDGIDDRLLALLQQRASLMAGVIAAKRNESGASAALSRPAREAAILRRLIGANHPPLPDRLVAQIWRAILVHLTALQGKFEIAVAERPGRASPAVMLAADYYGVGALRMAGDARAAMTAVVKGRSPLAVLPAPEFARGEASRWWSRLPEKVHVLAALPFLASGAGDRPRALVIGRQEFEPSGDDRLLLMLATRARLTPKALQTALREAGLAAARTLAAAPAKGGRTLLLEVESASPADQERLRAAIGAGSAVRCLGGYARPIVLPSSARNPP